MNFGASILDAEGLRLTREETALFRETDPFGFILFARNIENADQVRALCGDFRDAVGREAPILIDQEGGRVQRIWAPMARNWTPPLDFVATAGEHAERAMYLRYRLIALELHGLGIDTNCAPCGDLARTDTHSFLKNRCYASEPDKVSSFAMAVARGLLDGGVLPVIKHMPGHGRAQLDTHFDLPQVELTLAELEASDFAAFRPLADLPMGMTGHVVFSALTDKAATVSPEAIAVIRNQIGFGGLLMTDDISMQALKGEPQDRARAALDAGCDVALFCNAPLDQRRTVAETAGRMTDAAHTRAQAALAARNAPLDFDVQSAEAELDGLLGGRAYV